MKRALRLFRTPLLSGLPARLLRGAGKSRLLDWSWLPWVGRGRRLRRLEIALDTMSQGLTLYDADERLEVANRSFREIFQLPAASLVPGTSYRDVVATGHALGNFPGLTLQQVYSNRRTAIERREAARVFQTLADGRTISIWNQPMPGGGWVTTFEDITGRLQIERQMAFQAQHDALTGLPNRALILERIELALQAGASGAGRFALLFVDLDNFRGINDALGHPVGDKLLHAVAIRLRALVRESDTVARLAGDQFAILLAGVSSRKTAGRLGERIVREIGAPYRLAGQPVEASASIGIVVAPEDGEASQVLIKRADMALYSAKSEGQGICRFFEMGMEERADRERVRESELRRALRCAEFELYYQPIVDTVTGRPAAFEALARWRHPERGIVPPSEFIGLAEETGAIIALGAWVARQACQDATSWPADVMVSVNVSPVQFSSGELVDGIRDALADSGIAPSRLQLEITESILLQNNEANRTILHGLQALGIRIALDDFGTGYASLSYLRSFPFDTMKIDKSFVTDLAEKPDCRAIVGAIAGLGASLNMRVVAEGVETERQQRLLRDVGCRYMQGYLFGRPAPLVETSVFFQGACQESL